MSLSVRLLLPVRANIKHFHFFLQIFHFFHLIIAKQQHLKAYKKEKMHINCSILIQYFDGKVDCFNVILVCFIYFRRYGFI